MLGGWTLDLFSDEQKERQTDNLQYNTTTTFAVSCQTMAPITKRRKLSPPTEEKTDEAATDSFYSNASKWNLEQDYEQRPRKLKKKEAGKEGGRLPIKTAEGWVEQEEAAPAPAAPAEDEDENDSFLGSGDEEEEVEEEEEEKAPAIPLRQQIMTAKEELAKYASNISEDPEEYIAQLKHLSTIGASPVPAIKKLALATQLAVYKDIIPGYRIRPLTDEDMRTKLSKDIRKLRNFEQALLGGYNDYIKDLTYAAKNSGDPSSHPYSNKDKAAIASVAITCACTLLTTVPHFNFRGDVLAILVGKLSTRNNDADFQKCRETIETLFRDDEDGNASLEAVQMLTKMLKSRSYHVHESVLNTFLHLRLLSEFIHKASTNRIDKRRDDDAPKLKKKDREYRSKKERKRVKENKVVEKELSEADAVVSHEQRDEHQAEMLKLVFVAYFRILKARIPSLMGAVLEGLARYAHLINQDFFGDILEALREMIATAETTALDGNTADSDDEQEDNDDEDDEENKPRNLNRESLLCIITAFALLQGQMDVVKSASTLHLDLDFFITHLYRTLLPSSLNPDIELSAKSIRLSDPNTGENAVDGVKRKVNIQTTTVLLLRSLSSALLPPTATRSVPPLRVAAFTKTLLTASLQLPEKSCLAMMGLLSQIMRVQGKKVSALWYTEERKGDGVWKGDTSVGAGGEVESGNPFAATIWEGEILRKHFAPGIREAHKILEKGVVRSRT